MAERTQISPEDIKRIRTTLGMSQVKFAEELGVSRTTVAAWEMPNRTKNARRPASGMAKYLLSLERPAPQA